MEGAGSLLYLLSNRHLRGVGADPLLRKVARARNWRLWCAARGGRADWGSVGCEDRQRPAEAVLSEGRFAVALIIRVLRAPRAAAGILTKPVLFAAWCLGKGKGRADTRSRRGRRGSPGHRSLPGRFACPQLLP